MSQNNPFDAFNKAFEAFKPFGKVPSVDFEGMFAAGRRNVEVLADANKVLSEGAQAVAKRQFEIAQANAEKALDLVKEIASSKDPKEAAAKQADSIKGLFEKTVADANELVELASKSNTKAYEIVGKQVSENIKEISKTASKVKKATEETVAA